MSYEACFYRTVRSIFLLCTVLSLSVCTVNSREHESDISTKPSSSQCTKGDTQEGSTACGHNDEGILMQDCTEGQWEDTTTCVDDDVCVNGATQEGMTVACGINGTGVLMQDCTEGQWVDNTTCVDDDVCVNGATQEGTSACGINDTGVMMQDCVNGQWEDNTTCIDDDVCVNGATQEDTTACGLNDEGVLLQDCTNGQWVAGTICTGASGYLSFDGEDDNVNMGDPEDGVLDFGIAAYSYAIWIKTSFEGFQQILCKRGDPGGYEIQTIDNGVVGAGQAYSGVNTSDGAWHHLVFVYTGEEDRLFVDGLLVSTGTPPEDDPANGSSDGVLRVGDDSFQGENFTGDLDEVAIWNAALGEDEVARIYASSRRFDATQDVDAYVSSAHLVGYWRFNENSGSTAYDTSGNENHGIINGATWKADTSLTACIDYCASSNFQNSSTDVSCNQMLSCRNACYLRDDGAEVSECEDHCDRPTGMSGCSLTVRDREYSMCGECIGGLGSAELWVECTQGCNFEVTEDGN